MTRPGDGRQDTGGAVVLDQPWQIHLARLAALRGGLALQARGIKVTPGASVLSRLRAEGIVSARTVAKAIPQLDSYISDVKAGYGLICTVCRQDDTTQAMTSESGQTAVNLCDNPGCTERAARDADDWERQPNG